MNTCFDNASLIDGTGGDVHVEIMKLTCKNASLLSGFCSGNELIDDFFKNQAASSIREVTYLFYDPERRKAAACVSVSCSSLPVVSSDVYTDTVPAVEITNLALDENYQKLHMADDPSLGYFSDSVLNYMVSVVNDFSSDYCGATHIILYSTPQAIHFYERNGFSKITASHFMIRHNYYLEGCTPMLLEL